MKSRTVTCIGCPLGCYVTVDFDAEGNIKGVSGNTCPRGETYARKEVTSPTRTVTSIVRIAKGEGPVVSVKTASDIPKDKIDDCMKELKEVLLTAPVKIGDIVVSDICGTGVPVIVTKEMEAI